jgi:hypothetical protein
MADAKPSKIHENVEPEKTVTPETIRVIDVGGKAIKVVGEQKLPCGTVRRDYA